MISGSISIHEALKENPYLDEVLARYKVVEDGTDQSLELFFDGDKDYTGFLIEIAAMFEKPCYYPREALMQYSIQTILDYLKRTHRYYLDKRLFTLELSISGLSNAYGVKHPLIVLLSKFFTEYKDHLVGHITLEEELLFPYVEALIEGKQPDGSYSLNQFTADHEDEAESQIRLLRHTISDKFPEVETTFPYRVFNRQMLVFERDLFIHALIEDDILVPKARELEPIR